MIIVKILLGILAIIVVVMLFAIVMLSGNIKNIKRIDEEGYLYSCDYTGKYHSNPLASLPVRLVSGIGCSAFFTHNEDGDVLTARNFDQAHVDKNGNVTGLNIIIRFAPKKKYRSVCIADAAFLSVIKIPYSKGSLDNKKVPTFPLTALPYLCVDGINEKGLTASILALDTKKGETFVNQSFKGRKKANVSQLLRYVLDDCATVDEAIALASKYNMVNILAHDFHLFLTDANGKYVVLEWRYNEMQVVYTDAATNCYVGFDDGEDALRDDGTIKEVFEKPDDIPDRYHYGYGHGFDRLTVMIRSLMWATESEDPYYTQMSDERAMDVLSEISQEYDAESSTSCTQYSVVYNNTKRTFDICAVRDYKNVYHFSL